MMTYETRTKAVHALRTTTAPQICYLVADESGGRCAVGVVAEAFGWRASSPDHDVENEAYDVVAAQGIEADALWRRNDASRRSFSEIADWLERQPVSDPPVVPSAVPAEWTVSKAIVA